MRVLLHQQRLALAIQLDRIQAKRNRCDQRYSLNAIALTQCNKFLPVQVLAVNEQVEGAKAHRAFETVVKRLDLAAIDFAKENHLAMRLLELLDHGAHRLQGKREPVDAGRELIVGWSFAAYSFGARHEFALHTASSAVCSVQLLGQQNGLTLFKHCWEVAHV